MYTAILFGVKLSWKCSCCQSGRHSNYFRYHYIFVDLRTRRTGDYHNGVWCFQHASLTVRRDVCFFLDLVCSSLDVEQTNSAIRGARLFVRAGCSRWLSSVSPAVQQWPATSLGENVGDDHNGAGAERNCWPKKVCFVLCWIANNGREKTPLRRPRFFSLAASQELLIPKIKTGVFPAPLTGREGSYQTVNLSHSQAEASPYRRFGKKKKKVNRSVCLAGY